VISWPGLKLFDSYDAFGPTLFLFQVTEPTVHDLLRLRRSSALHGFDKGSPPAHIFNEPQIFIEKTFHLMDFFIVAFPVFIPQSFFVNLSGTGSWQTINEID
jgi:hypothetical protein